MGSICSCLMFTLLGTNLINSAPLQDATDLDYVLFVTEQFPVAGKTDLYVRVLIRSNPAVLLAFKSGTFRSQKENMKGKGFLCLLI